MRLAMRLAYVGTRYHGWQVQAPNLADRTIQGQVEAALGRLAGHPVRAFGSGRTDAGVHADGQVVHFDLDDERFGRVRDWRHALNAVLPEDIRVLELRRVADDFHARVSASDKTYRYLFWRERGFVPPRLVPFVWRCGPLDVARMRAALPALLGTHDFAALANAGTRVEDTTRTMTAIDLEELAPDPSWPRGLPMLAMTVTGTGFLKQMVRNMAGLLADVGRGRIAPDAVAGLVATASRTAVPSATAPARGLTLLRVRYGEQGAPAGVPFEQAVIMACRGLRVARPGWGEDFLAVRDGRLLKGRYLGESSFMDMHPWEPATSDRVARDWRVFERALVDPWEGCEVPQGPGEGLR